MRSGAYREPIIQGLQGIDPELAVLFQRGDIKFAIAGSIVGGVTVRRDLTDLCVRALEAAGPQYAEEKAYYIDGLRSGRVVPVSTSGVNYIATGTSAEDAMKKQAAVLAAQPEKVYKPGELFFNS